MTIMKKTYITPAAKRYSYNSEVLLLGVSNNTFAPDGTEGLANERAVRQAEDASAVGLW